MSVTGRHGQDLGLKAKELQIYAKLLKKYVDISKPVKQSSRYMYFEVEGDLLNPQN